MTNGGINMDGALDFYSLQDWITVVGYVGFTLLILWQVLRTKPKD
ncbi:MAG: hypothetical protein SFW36_12050 [Leptolyngbyaceae cyanobacterium bins.59]|nr:hypothetical protein [Leptolyngbyaceae cyanobacterium bins.59]